MKFFRRFWEILAFISLLVWISMVSKCVGKTVKKRDVMENISSGIRYAGQMFGINTAADVANLVAKAFAGPPKKPRPDFSSLFQQMFGTEKQEEQLESTPDSQSEQYNEQSHSDYGENQRLPVAFVANLLKVVGLDAGKITAMAINVLIIIAQMINKMLIGDKVRKQYHENTQVDDDYDDEHEHQPRDVRPGSPFDWFLELPSAKVTQVIHQITDPELPNKIIDLVRNSTEADTGCIQLLVCKIAPFIWGMQLSLHTKVSNIPGAHEPFYKDFNEESARQKEETLTDSLYRHMPDKMEYRRNGEVCEKRFSELCERKCVKSPHKQ